MSSLIHSNCVTLLLKRPAQMNSFAVLSLAGGRIADEFMSKFLNCAGSHGLQMPDVNPRSVLSNVVCTSNSSSPSEVRRLEGIIGC